MGIDLFILKAFNPDTRFEFGAWVFTIVVSIVLHELAHGITAIRLGDDTPRRLNRMTLNPLVHMGPFSLLALFVVGIAWGSMPIDHTRLRGRYAEAKVAFAGPSTNLLLGILGLVALGLVIRFDLLPGQTPWADNAAHFLEIFGFVNLLLFAFNMLPVPPLDGSHILANLNHGYARFIDDPSKQGVFILMFFFAFAMLEVLIEPLANVASWIVYQTVTLGA